MATTLTNPFSRIQQGLSGGVRSLFKGEQKPIHEKTEKPSPRDISAGYEFDRPVEWRLKSIADYYYREGSFEKIQFARKWMRNALIFQGYHELEWSEINVAWDVLLEDSGDYAFPNNYYRSLVMDGAALYLQGAPGLQVVPATDDPDSEAAAEAAKVALELIKQEVRYDHIRATEAIYLRLFGNSFRYSYYSRDPRYGTVTADAYQDIAVVLSAGISVCQNCGMMEGQFDNCPGCGQPPVGTEPPIVAQVPTVTGKVEYPKGGIVSEIVNPLEVYIRSSSLNLWDAPFLVRSRVVDRLSLQAAYKDIKITPNQDEGGGEAYATGGDLGLIYMQSLADLPGDPTQYAAWYERATTAAKALLIEAWVRPSLYFFDKELSKKFPKGLYIAKTGDTLLEAREESVDDHWVHIPYIPVPGRIWGDGDDDLIPKQLLLDETDRLIARNQAYNSSPLLAIDSQRIDKNDIINDPSTIIEVKPSGQPIDTSYGVIQSQPLAQEVWQWRGAHLADMQFHSGVMPAAIGGATQGVRTFGGQESLASRTVQTMSPNLFFYKEADQRWAVQVLKLAAENWLDERVHATMGINMRWQYTKLRGEMLSPDRVRVLSTALPVDPKEQEAMAEAIQAEMLNPQDPRVQKKALELFGLPQELDGFSRDAKVQWKEIEKMKQTGQQVPPVMIRDNDMVHIEICREFLNSDDADDNQQLSALIYQHLQLHVQNQVHMQQMMATVQAAGQEATQAVTGGQGQPSPANGQPSPPPEPHGGQVPKSAAKREKRAQKGAAAKPHRPQKPSGNQYDIRRAF